MNLTDDEVAEARDELRDLRLRLNAAKYELGQAERIVEGLAAALGLNGRDPRDAVLPPGGEA